MRQMLHLGHSGFREKVLVDPTSLILRLLKNLKQCDVVDNVSPNMEPDH